MYVWIGTCGKPEFMFRTICELNATLCRLYHWSSRWGQGWGASCCCRLNAPLYTGTAPCQCLQGTCHSSRAVQLAYGELQVWEVTLAWGALFFGTLPQLDLPGPSPHRYCCPKRNDSYYVADAESSASLGLWDVKILHIQCECTNPIAEQAMKIK